MQALDLPSLVYRRHRGDMIEVYKFIHGIYKSGHNGTFACIERTYAQVEGKALLHTVEVQFFLVQSRQSVERSSKRCGISSVSGCFQGKVGQALEGVLLYTGP